MWLDMVSRHSTPSSESEGFLKVKSRLEIFEDDFSYRVLIVDFNLVIVSCSGEGF